MEGIREYNVAGDVFCVMIRDVNGWINLKVVIEAPGYTRGIGVFVPTLVINLEAPVLVKVVGISKHRFRAAMDDQAASDEFVVFSVVAAFEKGLRCFSASRPVHEAGGQKPRILLHQGELTAKDCLGRLNTLECSNLEPFGNSKLCLELVWIGDLFALPLKTQ